MDAKARGEVTLLLVPAAVQVACIRPEEPAGEETEAPAPPERLGPYRIVSTLGQGGMGTVYLAEQDEPVRRRVALKVIDALHDRSLRKRFAAECQALARLGHPNIASLYEVGATDDGRPFVVMELVEGREITAWCDEHRLDLAQRIRLFFGVWGHLIKYRGVWYRVKRANKKTVTVSGWLGIDSMTWQVPRPEITDHHIPEGQL